MAQLRGKQTVSVGRRKRSSTRISVHHVLLAVIGLACLMIGVARLFSTSFLDMSHLPDQTPLEDALKSSQTISTLKPLGEPTESQVEEPLNEVEEPLEPPSQAATPQVKPVQTPEVVLEKKPGFPGSKAVIAYAISITSCELNATTVFDGPAILGHSIHQTSIRHNSSLSKYDYSLYAFLHPDAAACTSFLEYLGYTILIRDIPFSVNDIQSESYREGVEKEGCCGSREFLKLWAYTLSNHDIVVHTDTDVMLLKPMDPVFDAMLDADAKPSLPVMYGTPLPSKIDFVYTRDYLQRSRLTRNPKRFGVQGGFFIVRPDMQIFKELKETILKGDYERATGWANLQYGGYWGAPQIQGFLSYFYGELHPEHAVELNRCYYNTMVDDPPEADGKCRTAEKTCEDCRETPLSDMVSVHLTTCWKPWHCPLLKAPHPERCKDVHRAWFDLRKSLELSWGYDVPTDGWWFKRTLGYCAKQKPIKKRYYLPLQIPNMTKREPIFKD